MSTTSFGAVLASFALCCLAPQSASTHASTSPQSYVVQCEVWNASDPSLVAQIEAQEATAAEAVLQSLRGADQGVQRLARVLSPIDVGSQARFESQHDFATLTVTQSGAGTQTGFGGYSSTGTVVTLGCSPSGVADVVKLALSLDVSGFQGDGNKRAPGTPPDRHSIQVHCEGDLPWVKRTPQIARNARGCPTCREGSDASTPPSRRPTRSGWSGRSGVWPRSPETLI